VLTISGEAGQCVKCVDLVLAKLSEQEDTPTFANRGTSYSMPGSNYFAAGGRGPPRSGGRGRGDGGRAEKRQYNNNSNNNANSEVDTGAMAQTNITISIPNELVGNIFGRQGSKCIFFSVLRFGCALLLTLTQHAIVQLHIYRFTFVIVPHLLFPLMTFHSSLIRFCVFMCFAF
jgi:hypothetical protein